MKKHFFTIAIAIFYLGIIGCHNSSSNTANETTNTASPTQTNEPSSNNSTPVSNESSKTIETDIFKQNNTENKQPVTPDKTNNKSNTSNQPKVATIKNMVNGDLKCYVSLVDEKGAEREIGATFEVCEDKDKLLNKKVNLSYENVNVNDCESAEPCGKTKIESLIAKMEVVEDKSSTKSDKNDSHTISNGEWTIVIGNRNSWSGVNGTGNLSYRGCNAKDQCLELTGGKIACRQGICTTGWRNGDYTYVVKQPITVDDKQNDSLTTLEVRKNGKVILAAKGFQTVN